MATHPTDPTQAGDWHSETLTERKALLEELTGRPLGAEIFEFIPWGRRLIVVRETPQEMIGSIHVPPTAQRELSQGWVLSAGDQVGLPGPGIGWSPFNPENLIGRKVMFAKYAGADLNPSDVPRSPYEQGMSLFVMLTDGDIFGHLL